MLIQHKFKMPLKLSLVNKTLMAVIIAGSAITLPTTASASNYDDVSVKKSVHKVKFSRTDLKTADGVATVYARLKTQAKKACASGINVDREGNITDKQECAKDMLAQFVKSADLPTLNQYHLMKDAATKSAGLFTP